MIIHLSVNSKTNMTIEYVVPKNLDRYDDQDKIYKYLRKQIKQDFKGPTKKYLLQCAKWEQLYGDYNSNVWIALSPIGGYLYGDWPLYSIDVNVSDETNIIFRSWKGDFNEETLHFMYGGTLKKGHEDDKFAGEIYTRGR